MTDLPSEQEDKRPVVLVPANTTDGVFTSPASKFYKYVKAEPKPTPEGPEEYRSWVARRNSQHKFGHLIPGLGERT